MLARSFRRLFASESTSAAVVRASTSQSVTPDTLSSSSTTNFVVPFTNNSKTQQSSTNDPQFRTDGPIEKLSPDHPIVRRLFRPFIHADFISQGVDAKGNPLPPNVPYSELEWLHKHAYLFGLHPERDLHLPPLNPPTNEPLDRRVAADLARIEARRQRHLQLHDRRLEKQRLQMIKQKSMTFEELEEALERDEEEKASWKLPLRFQSSEYRREMEEQRVKTIGELMADMPRRIEEYRERRRQLRRKYKEAKKLF
jgi:hypothetical protein